VEFKVSPEQQNAAHLQLSQLGAEAPAGKVLGQLGALGGRNGAQGAGAQTQPIPCVQEKGKMLPGSEEKRKRHPCEYPRESRRSMRRLPCSPRRVHLEQAPQVSIHGGSRAKGCVLKEPQPTLEHGKSVRSRREELLFPIPLCC